MAAAFGRPPPRSTLPSVDASQSHAAYVALVFVESLKNRDHLRILEEAYVVVGWWWRKNKFMNCYCYVRSGIPCGYVMFIFYLPPSIIHRTINL